jgi:hypothetical protein
MIVRVRGVSRLAVLLALATACARTSSEKSGDSAALDSAKDTTSPAGSGAVTPAPDTTVTAPASNAPTSNAPASNAPASGAGSRTSPSPTPTPTPTVTPSETVLTGTIAVGGLAADQRTMLQVEGGAPTRLTGPLEPELRRLNAATVWVAGAPGGAAPNASFAVSRYEIVAIDGAKPVVGVLTTRAGATWLVAERDTVKLSATTPEMLAKVGAKVWVIGRRTGAEMTPQTFGVIREP